MFINLPYVTLLVESQTTKGLIPLDCTLLELTSSVKGFLNSEASENSLVNLKSKIHIPGSKGIRLNT